MEYSELHDATLQTIQLRWAEGTVRVEVVYFKDGARHRGSILGIDVSGIGCPRAFPWGESNSISEASTNEHDGEVVLRMRDAKWRRNHNQGKDVLDGRGSRGGVAVRAKFDSRFNLGDR